MENSIGGMGAANGDDGLAGVSSYSATVSLLSSCAAAKDAAKASMKVNMCFLI